MFQTTNQLTHTSNHNQGGPGVGTTNTSIEEWESPRESVSRVTESDSWQVSRGIKVKA